MGVGPERSQRESSFLRFEGEGIDLDFVEEIFAALLAREEVIDPCNEGVAAEFEGMAAGIEAESFGELGTVFAGGAREQVGAPDTVDDVRNLNERVGGVGIGLPEIAGELRAEMADEARSEA